MPESVNHALWGSDRVIPHWRDCHFFHELSKLRNLCVLDRILWLTSEARVRAAESRRAVSLVQRYGLWTSPVSGSFKLNVDAALDSDIGRYGAGLIIRDDRGLIIVADALSFNGNVPVDIAEAKAVLEGLLMAVDLGLFPLCIESDAQGVVGLCTEVNISNGDIDNIITYQ
ncbi:hypothetical protein Q3G72_006262 [Acer saccharum]|nr:hypothetical protein Q3G72_006262 [Acer saccharum]